MLTRYMASGSVGTPMVQLSGLVLKTRNKEVWFHDRKDGSRKKRFQR